jgi:two-component system sensor histidine kinase MprB
MSLRWRLALALGLLGATAVVLVATVAYAATSRQLRGESDDFLAARTEQVLAAARRQGPDHTFPGRDGFPAPPVGLGASLYQYDAVAQVIDTDGTVAATAGKVPLPIDEADRVLAASESSRSRRRTASLDGTPYRIQTTALPGGGALQIGRDVSEAERVLDRLRIQLAAVGGIVTALAAAAGYLIARRTAAPVGRLTVAAEHVAATGDLDADLPAGGTDETGRLAAAFTTMLERLAASRAQQQQLVQDASHELRTPLTSLRTNVEVLRRHPELGAEARQPILADLDAEARELADLVDELVELATDRRDDEATQEVDLGALAERVAARARRRTGRVVAVERAGAAVVSGQPQALERAVANLVDNAAKFSPDGTPIEIVVTGGRVEVRDHGSGIPDADRARVFDRFYRAATARAQPGSGLGLAIVRQVAERHHGRVFAGGPPGGGAVVGFEVPAAAT